jgi:hypothetical protein
VVVEFRAVLRLEQSIESLTTILPLDISGKTRLLKELYFTLSKLGWTYFLYGSKPSRILNERKKAVSRYLGQTTVRFITRI